VNAEEVKMLTSYCLVNTIFLLCFSSFDEGFTHSNGRCEAFGQRNQTDLQVKQSKSIETLFEQRSTLLTTSMPLA